MLVFSGAQLLIGVVGGLTLSDPVLLSERNELFFFSSVPIERSHVDNSFSPKGVLNPCASQWLSRERRKDCPVVNVLKAAPASL